jgi:hypothetical protein
VGSQQAAAFSAQLSRQALTHRHVAGRPQHCGAQLLRANQHGSCDDVGSFRWTLHDGLSIIGQIEVTDFTEDGQLILGEILDDQKIAPRSFHWTQAGGSEEFLPFAGADSVSLPQPRTNAAGSYEDTDRRAFGTRAMSSDGSFVAGTSSLSTSVTREPSQAFRWTPSTGMQPLPALAGDTWSQVGSVSRDGAIIVGASGHGTSSNAVFWDAQGAVHSVAEALSNAGIDFSGSQLLSTDGAANARVLWGLAQPSGTGARLWLVRLPEHA